MRPRITPGVAVVRLAAGDHALNRIDVSPALDGVQPGLAAVDRLVAKGVRVLNAPAALLATHDKLETARLLARAGLPQPQTAFVPPDATDVDLPTPLVLKPRYRSWGLGVARCTTPDEVRVTLARVRSRPWFRRHGAIAQVFVPHSSDIRLVIAGHRLVGAVERAPRDGEWRTTSASAASGAASSHGAGLSTSPSRLEPPVALSR